MMEEVGGDWEGKKRGENGEEKSIYVHGAKITSLSIPSTAPSSVPSHPPKIWKEMEREKTSGRDEHGRGECMCESYMAEVNVCVSLKGINPTLQFFNSFNH